MKNFFNTIKKSLGLVPESKYGGWTTNEWHYHYRRERKLDEDKIMVGLNDVSGNEIELSISDIEEFYLKSISPIQLCLCCCLFSVEATPSAKVIEKLIQSLSHENELVRRFSAIALADINTVESLSAVVKGNNHGHAIRTEAAWKLKEYGKEAEGAVLSLISLIEYKNINCRSHMAASEALASIGAAAKDELSKRLDSTSKSTRFFCADALKEMDNEKVIQDRIEYILEHDW